MKKKYILLVAMLALLKINLMHADDYAGKDDFKRHFFYAPEREQYIEESFKKRQNNKSKKKKECFFCQSSKRNPIKKNVLIKRFRHLSVILNEYPYNRGHLLICPNRHIPSFEHMTQKEKLEMLKLIEISLKVLKKTLKADGANVGINVGRAAGASIPGHLHIHVVPRYNQKHPSFIFPGVLETTANSTVICWSMPKLYQLLKKHFDNYR